MMKKIFALVVLLVLGKMSYSQYPLQQNLGSDSTLVISKGALQSRLINVTYTDTSAANLQRIRQYPGAQIATTTGGLNLWVRNANATAWVPVATGSGNNIYTIDGTLLGNRTLSGGTNSLTFQGLSNFKVTTTDSVRLANSQQYFILSDTLAKLERAGKATILVNSLNGGARIVLNPTGPADERKYEINAQNEEFWIAQISDSEALGDTIFFVNATGNVGIGTTSPDSSFTVANGVLFQSGVRMSGLPTASGTKGLRVDANGTLSVSDTLTNGISGSGISNYMTRWTAANSVDTSQLYQNGQNLGLGTITPDGRLAIVDTGGFALKINYNSASTDANNNAALYAENNGLSSYVAILNEKTTNNTGGQYPILIESSLTTGTAQSGMATGIHFGTPDDAGNKKVTQLALRTTNAAAANYTNRAELRLWNNGTSSTPYYLLGNGNMGLGTSTPDSNLTVVNGAYFQRGVRMSGLPTAVGTKSLRVDASGTLSLADTLANGVSGSGTTNYVSKFTGTNAVGNSSIFDNGSAVGIGTSTPSSYGNIKGLTINGVEGGLIDLSGNGVRQFSVYTLSDGSAYLGTTTNASLFLTTNGTPNSVLTNAGKFGIGTITPDSMLMVTQGAYFQRGVRMSGLPTGVGTKALRIDASGTLSIADTLANGISGTGTTNYIPKFTSSSAIGNSNIYDDGTNVGIGASVGINTTVPGGSLDIRTASGSLSFRSQSNNATAANNSGVLIYNTASATASTRITQLVLDPNGANASGTDYFIIQSAGDGKTDILNTKSDGYITFGTANTERMRITAAGDIGIGITSPSSKLQVVGRVTAQSALLSHTMSNGDVIAWFDNNNTTTDQSFGLLVDAGTSANDYALRVRNAAGSELFRINGAGNLGLGVTPSAWNTGKAFEVGQLGNSVWGEGNGDMWVLANTYYNAGFKYANSIAAGAYNISKNSHKWYIAASGTAGNAITFTQAMTLDASGRLGIGTTSPQVTLHVDAGANAEYARFNSTNASGGYFRVTNSGSLLGLFGAAGQTIAGGSASDLGIYAAANLLFGTGTGFPERMRITSAGNVGIGTTSPSYLLDINSSTDTYSQLRTSSLSGDVLLGFSNTGDANNGWGIGRRNTGEFWIANYTGNFLGGTRTVPFMISTGGNVGIGTSSPTSRLHTTNTLNSATAVALLEQNQSNTVNATALVQIKGVNGLSGASGKLELTDGTYYSYIQGGRDGVTTNSYLAFGTTTNERMRITSGGDVGIGTTSPNQQLEVKGAGLTYVKVSSALNTSFRGIAFGIENNATINGSVAMEVSGGELRITSGYSTYGGFQTFYTNGSERMRLDANGSVGIGTTSLTGYNLRVNKNITGSTSTVGIRSEGQIQSDVTGDNSYFSSGATTANATFTIGTIAHYIANQGTFGASSTVTNQIGFRVAANLTGAANNYGFYGDIASGTNRWNLYMNGTANNYIAGSVGIGTTSLTAKNLAVDKVITGGVNAYSIITEAAIQSDVTTHARYFRTTAGTQNATFTLANLTHYEAFQTAFGASSTVTTQNGFNVSSTMTGATNNLGFRGQLAAASGRWNLYMDGTANNYLAGNLSIGSTSLNASAALQVVSTTQGFLPPVMSGSQAEAIATPADGLLVYVNNGNGTTITSTGFWGRDAGAWVKLN